MINSNTFNFSNFKESVFKILSEIKIKRENNNKSQNEIEKHLNDILLLKYKLTEVEQENAITLRSIQENVIEPLPYQNNIVTNEYEFKIHQFTEILNQNKEHLCSLQLENYKLNNKVSKLELANAQLTSQSESCNGNIVKLKEYIIEICQKIKQLEQFLDNLNVQIQEYKLRTQKCQVTMRHYECLNKSHLEEAEKNESKLVNLQIMNDKLLNQIQLLNYRPQPVEYSPKSTDKFDENIKFCQNIEAEYKKLMNTVTSQTEQNKTLRDELSHSNHQIVSLEDRLKWFHQDKLDKDEIIKSLEAKISSLSTDKIL